MRFIRRGSRPRATLLLMLLLLGASPLTGLSGTQAADVGTTQVDTTVAPLVPADPSGTGMWERAGCVMCTTAFLAAGGTTILGVAVASVIFPELALACGLTCAYAFG